MRKIFTFKSAVILSAITYALPAFSADLPKEGRYDTTNCWSGVANLITFSATHTARSYEMTGSVRSNPPGGMFDNSSFRCVGMDDSLNGKTAGRTVCEAIGGDGDKRLNVFPSRTMAR